MENSIIIRTKDEVFSVWETSEVILMLDTVASTFKFTAFRNESNAYLFRPGSSIECTVEMLNEGTGQYDVLITGYIMNTGLTVSKIPGMETISGYSKTGILETVPLPPDFMSMQFEGESLRSIAQRICDYYGLVLEVHNGAKDAASIVFTDTRSIIKQKNEEGAVSSDTEKDADELDFKKLQANRTESCKNFLSRISKERGITVSHDNLGRLLLYRIVETIPVQAEIDEKTSIYGNMTMQPNWQQVHSSMTVYRETEASDEGESHQALKYTALSPFYKGIGKVKIPAIVEAKTLSDKQLKKYCEFLLCQEAKAFMVNIVRDGWTFEDIVNTGPRIVRAGFYLNITAPGLFLKPRLRHLVDKISYIQKTKTGVKECHITAVLSCCYSGILPKESPFIEL